MKVAAIRLKVTYSFCQTADRPSANRTTSIWQMARIAETISPTATSPARRLSASTARAKAATGPALLRRQRLLDQLLPARHLLGEGLVGGRLGHLAPPRHLLR